MVLSVSSESYYRMIGPFDVTMQLAGSAWPSAGCCSEQAEAGALELPSHAQEVQHWPRTGVAGEALRVRRCGLGGEIAFKQYLDSSIHWPRVMSLSFGPSSALRGSVKQYRTLALSTS